MPPRPSTAVVRTVVRTVVRNGPILPFLYPAASRRFLNTPPPGGDDGQALNDKLIGIFDNLRKASPSSNGLPSLPDESPTSGSYRSSQSGGANFADLQQRRRAFKDMAALNTGTKALVTKLQEMAELRKGYEGSMDRVDPEIFRHSVPMLDRSYLSPKDLSYEEYQKFNYSRRDRIRADVFDTLKEDPLSYYKNFNLLKDFMTTAGRIKHRSITGLSNTNQRKLSKAIRRSIGIGLMPSVHRHPIILTHEQRVSSERFKPTEQNRDDRDRPRREPINMRLHN